MRQRATILAVVVVVAVAGACQAWEFNWNTEVGASYMTRYIWRGFDVYGRNHSAVQPFVNFSCPEGGWSGGVWMSRANGSGFENYEEVDYWVAYDNGWWADTSYATNYQFGYMYYNYPDGPISHSCHDRDLDAHEMWATLSWPNMCSQGIVPSYTAIRMWQAEGGLRTDGCPWSNFRGSGGWIHVLGMSYDQPVPGWFPSNPDQTLHWTAQTVYNDHMGGDDVDHDWSHAVFGVSSDFPTVAGGTLTPGIWYQSSWDDSVNTSDEWWAGITGRWQVN